jgi:feruloyl esterase
MFLRLSLVGLFVAALSAQIDTSRGAFSPIARVSCESLASVSLPHTAITSAKVIPAGTFAAPDQQFNNLPEFCRVIANSRPTGVSDIQLEIWLPVASWNGKFQTGNLGAGIPAGIRFPGLAAALRNGYATGGASAYRSLAEMTNRPERMADWAYRAAHELAATGKSLATAFYGDVPKLSLINECGGGSIPALNAPPRYPEDYDAVVVGGYTTDRTHMIFGQLWPWVAAHRTEASAIPPAKLALLHNAAVATCDLGDGVRDGVIDPPRCNFDPKVLLCPAGDGPNCLTSAQVRTAQEIYAGPINPRTGKRIYSPFRPGSELGWAQLTGLERTRFSGPEGFRIEAYEVFRHLVFKNPNWTYKARPVDFDADVHLAESAENRLLDGVLNNELTDLKKFVERGGKLLLHSGWADPNVPPGGVIEYYNRVVDRLGEKESRNAVRLFMVPGMGHCPGTTGEDNFDFDGLGIVERWRESGQAPDRLIATRYKNGVEAGKRLVCPYPQVSMYRGTGSTDDPANFLCREP